MVRQHDTITDTGTLDDLGFFGCRLNSGVEHIVELFADHAAFLLLAFQMQLHRLALPSGECAFETLVDGL